MSGVRFTEGLHFWLHSQEYVIQERQPRGNYQILNVRTQEIFRLTEKELVQFFFSGKLEFSNPSTSGEPQSYLTADFPEIAAPLKAEAKRKEEYVQAVLEQKIEKYTKESLTPVIKQVAQAIKDDKPPSHITLYRWLKDYNNSGGDVRSLVPRYLTRGNYNSKINPEVHQLIDEVIAEVYLTPNQPTIAQVYDVVICRILQENSRRQGRGQDALKIPHRTTIYRQIQSLDPYDKAVGRYGKRTANLIYNPVQDGPRPTRPLERVEIDHTLLPFFVFDTQTRMPIGTPSLTSAVDKYSGIIVGYYLSFEPFSSLSVMQCLLNAIQPKSYVSTKFPSVENTWDAYGLMETLVVDNGKEFYSRHFQDACEQLAITIQYTPPRMPWYKSTVERTFGSYNTQLLAGQPGALFKEFTTQYDYDPKKNAVVSLSALQEMIHIFIVDIYNQSSHPQFKCPRSEVWELAIAECPPILPLSSQELRVLVGAMDKRVISRRGVEFSGLYYNSPELARLRSSFEKEDIRRKSGFRQREKATIKYDPTDLSVIYVFDPTTHKFIVVPAVNQQYTQGLTLWQHRVIKNLAATESKKVDIVALALAKQKIQEIVEREWQKSSSGKSRKAMARWLGIGRDGLKEDESPAETELFIDAIKNSSRGTDQDLERFFHTANSRAGVSEFDSAFNPSQTLADTLAREPTKEKPKVTTDSPKSQSKTSKAKRTKKLGNCQKGDEDFQPDKSVSNTEDWKPDLSGWSVSIGLPK